MPIALTQANDVLRRAYRSTFREYSSKLDALQRLMSSGASDNGEIEAVLLEVEKARVAHNCARDLLARELVRPASPISSSQPSPPGGRVDERHIRETAQLLWELAGRPDGTAEGDWQRAEKLVHSVAARAC